jgi:hypothetical protein
MIAPIPPLKCQVAPNHFQQPHAIRAIANPRRAKHPVGTSEVRRATLRIYDAQCRMPDTYQNAYQVTNRVRFAKCLHVRSGRKIYWYSSQLDSFVFEASAQERHGARDAGLERGWFFLANMRHLLVRKTFLVSENDSNSHVWFELLEASIERFDDTFCKNAVFTRWCWVYFVGGFCSKFETVKPSTVRLAHIEAPVVSNAIKPGSQTGLPRKRPKTFKCLNKHKLMHIIGGRTTP